MDEADAQRPAASAAATLLRQAREDARLSQAQLARRAGVAISTVSRYESGRQAPSLAAVDRLLAAMGRQLHLSTEPLGADIDGAVDAAQATPLTERLARHCGSVDRIIDALSGVPFVIEGSVAAVLQGAPMPVDTLDIVVAETDLALLARSLKKMYAQRWSNRWRRWGYEVLDPREEGEPRWMTIYGEIRLRVVPERPSGLDVEVGDRRLVLRPLIEIEARDAGARRILARVRQRLGSAA